MASMLVSTVAKHFELTLAEHSKQMLPGYICQDIIKVYLMKLQNLAH